MTLFVHCNPGRRYELGNILTLFAVTCIPSDGRGVSSHLSVNYNTKPRDRLYELFLFTTWMRPYERMVRHVTLLMVRGVAYVFVLKLVWVDITCIFVSMMS